MLTGEYKYTIDAKKRLSLPSKFRKELGRKIIVTKGVDECLVVYSDKEWKVMADKLGKLPISQPETRKFTRVVLAAAMEVTFDGLGRILIPDYLKKYAGLKKDIIIYGLNDRLEVWDAKKWEIYRDRAEKQLGSLVSKLGDLGI